MRLMNGPNSGQRMCSFPIGLPDFVRSGHDLASGWIIADYALASRLDRLHFLAPPAVAQEMAADHGRLRAHTRIRQVQLPIGEFVRYSYQEDGRIVSSACGNTYVDEHGRAVLMTTSCHNARKTSRATPSLGEKPSWLWGHGVVKYLPLTSST